jgi:hypothetical protein
MSESSISCLPALPLDLKILEKCWALLFLSWGVLSAPSADRSIREKLASLRILLNEVGSERFKILENELRRILENPGSLKMRVKESARLSSTSGSDRRILEKDWSRKILENPGSRRMRENPGSLKIRVNPADLASLPNSSSSCARSGSVSSANVKKAWLNKNHAKM